MGVFDYDIPVGRSVSPGQIVRVPFRQRTVPGIVWAVLTESAVPPHRRRPIESVDPTPPLLGTADRSFTTWIANRYGVSLSFLVKTFLKRPWPHAQQRMPPKHPAPRPTALAFLRQPAKLQLGIFTRQQERVDFYRQVFAEPSVQPMLIIVPELSGLRSLTPLLPPGSVTVTSDQTKADQRLVTKQLPTAPVIVGTRSILLFPLPAIKLLVIDEEDNEQHKQRDQQPRVATLSLATELAKRRRLPLLALSVAPTVNAYALAGATGLFSLGTRPPPRLQLIDHRNARDGQRTLLRTLEELRGAHQRSFVFLNRRGLARLLLCPDCGWLARCPDCTTALVRETASLRCPTDGFRSPPPDQCPQCQNNALVTRLPGTAGLERLIERRWPGVTARIDRDQPAAELQGKAILIGTERAFPHLATFRPQSAMVIGIDAVFSQPSARAFERAFQLLRRIAATDSVQTMVIETRFPRHQLFQSFAASGVETFLANELATRQRFRLPPAQPLVAFDTRQLTAEALQHLRQWLERMAVDPSALRGPISVRQGRRTITRFLLSLATGFSFPSGGLTSLPESWIIDPEPQL